MSAEPLGVPDRLPVRRGLAGRVEVAAAQLLRLDAQQRRAAAEDVLDHDHALRAAEAAERGLGRLVGLGDPAVHLDVAGSSRRCRCGTAPGPAPARTGRGSSRRRWSAWPAARRSASSSSKPTSQVAWNGCRLPVMVMSWVRFSRSRTGRPVSVAPSAAIAARPCGCISLPPKPPPIRRHCTVTACACSPSTWATISWVSDGCWVLDWTKIWPFSSTRASAALRLQVEVLLAAELELAGEPVRAASPARRRRRRGETVRWWPWKLSAAIASRDADQRRAAARSRPRSPRRPAGRPPGSRRAPSRPRGRRTSPRRGTAARRACSPASLTPGHVVGGQHPDHAGDVVRRLDVAAR